MNYQHTALTALDDLILSFDRRLTTLEKSACSPASPAPSSVGPSVRGGESPSSPSSPSSGAAGATVSSDPSAAIRADPGRPKWLTEAMLPLPVGTERVRRDTQGFHRAYPVRLQWCGDWSNPAEYEDRLSAARLACEVYHVPSPQPEKAKPAAASAWEEFWRAQGVDDAKDREAMHYGDFNRFVAAREKAAVEEAKVKWRRDMMDIVLLGPGVVTETLPSGNVRAVVAPKPDAGRAEATGKEPLQVDAPKPRRAPEVVAREVWDTMPAGCVNDYIEFAAAAVRADRGEV